MDVRRLLWAMLIWTLFWIGMAFPLLLVFLVGVAFTSGMVYLINIDNEGEMLVKWFLAILLALVGAAAIVLLIASAVVLLVAYPEQGLWVLAGAVFIGLVWLFAVHLHTWLLDRAYVRNKKRARKLDLLAAHEEALAELAERDNAVRTER